MTRESEWDNYTRSRAMALMTWEAGQCGICGNYDSLVPLESSTRNVTWPQHGDRKFTVLQYRCLACGAAEIVKRDFHTAHEKDTPTPGSFLEADGRMFTARPATKEV